MQGDTQAQNGWEEGEMDRVAKGNMHGAKGVRGKQWSRAKRGWKGSLRWAGDLHPAQISSRLLCSGLPSGAFSGGAGEAEGLGV